MTHQSPNSHAIVDAEHRGWTLQAHSFTSFRGTDDGWVCYVTGPDSFHKLNIGRWATSELAFEHGRAYVDRRVDAPNQAATRQKLQKIRHPLLR